MNKVTLVIPVRKIDWALLRRQKRVLVGVTLASRKFPPGFLRAADGLLGLLDFLQDEAETVLGPKAVFGRRHPS